MQKVSLEVLFQAIIDVRKDFLSSGDIDSPVGYFSIVHISEDAADRAEMRKALPFAEEGADGLDKVEAGWYFISNFEQQNLIYDKCKNKDYALARFSLARAAYQEWEDGQLR